MKSLFLDTNVLLQCLKLEQLPWHEISKDEDISLLISRPVQEEIDHMKHDGNSRRAKRARAATTFIRSIILAQTSEAVIRDSAPRVSVRLAPPIALESPFPFLDLSRIDDRIIIEAIRYRDQHPDEDVALLTHDTQPMATSKHCGLFCIVVPDTWLLPPEPDDRDRKIVKLEGRLQKFEKSNPVIEVAFKDASGSQLHVARLNVMCYPALTPSEIEELAGLVANRHPITTDFSEPKPRPAPTILSGTEFFNLMGMQRRYQPPSAEEIRKYSEESYPEWINSVKSFFNSLPSQLERPTREYRFSVSISNNGYSPAEHVLVEFILSGGLLLIPIEDKDKSTQTGPLQLPEPPKPPRGRWVQTMNPFESFAATARSFEVYPGSPLDRILPDLSVRLPPKHDKNAFYWKPKRPTIPTTIWAFECDEFRHKTEQEHFEIRICVAAANPTTKGVLECRVGARNLHDPVLKSLPVTIEYERQNSVDLARSYV